MNQILFNYYSALFVLFALFFILFTYWFIVLFTSQKWLKLSLVALIGMFLFTFIIKTADSLDLKIDKYLIVPTGNNELSVFFVVDKEIEYETNSREYQLISGSIQPLSKLEKRNEYLQEKIAQVDCNGFSYEMCVDQIKQKLLIKF